jgi:RimJ/RimL family protein N-acetyltransferase
MKLLPLDSAERIELAAGWLGKYDNYKWLDFGNGVQQVTPITMKIMTQRDIHVFRIFTAGEADTPAGVVGLTNVDRNFKTASIWAVLGSKRFGGYTVEATQQMLTLGFSEIGLQAINAWTVETNVAAQRVLEQLHFRYIGRQRRCHYIDGRPLDRLLFDLLATEHQDLPHVGYQAARESDLRPVR